MPSPWPIKRISALYKTFSNSTLLEILDALDTDEPLSSEEVAEKVIASYSDENEEMMKTRVKLMELLADEDVLRIMELCRKPVHADDLFIASKMEMHEFEELTSKLIGFAAVSEKDSIYTASPSVIDLIEYAIFVIDGLDEKLAKRRKNVKALRKKRKRE